MHPLPEMREPRRNRCWAFRQQYERESRDGGCGRRADVPSGPDGKQWNQRTDQGEEDSKRKVHWTVFDANMMMIDSEKWFDAPVMLSQARSPHRGTS